LVSVTLREERRLRVLENRVLGKIFGPKRDRGDRGVVIAIGVTWEQMTVQYFLYLRIIFILAT
jgi:hypothetical protein